MQTYRVKLEAEVFKTFRCQKAANSLDIDVKKKSIHELSIAADIESKFNVGLILGASGSGKTTLAKQIYGAECFQINIDPAKAVIDQFPEKWSYDECASSLQGIGLTSVPHWIKPVYTLSNGQRARAEAALLMSEKTSKVIAIDEWTSVVDRTVAKAMSHCIQKHARRSDQKIVLLSCHYDVIEWLNPDWIIDCNKSEFIDRRLLRPEERERKEKLVFELREVDRSTWKYFSKYHYLSDRLPGGYIETYGLFHGDNQIGFQCFANYVPKRRGQFTMQMHSNRTVVHPDYAGLGLGMKIIDLSSIDMLKRFGSSVDIRAKFSSEPVYRAMKKNPMWELVTIDRQIGRTDRGSIRAGDGGFRENVKTYSFKFRYAAQSSRPQKATNVSSQIESTH